MGSGTTTKRTAKDNAAVAPRASRAAARPAAVSAAGPDEAQRYAQAAQTHARLSQQRGVSATNAHTHERMRAYYTRLSGIAQDLANPRLGERARAERTAEGKDLLAAIKQMNERLPPAEQVSHASAQRESVKTSKYTDAIHKQIEAEARQREGFPITASPKPARTRGGAVKPEKPAWELTPKQYHKQENDRRYREGGKEFTRKNIDELYPLRSNSQDHWRAIEQHVSGEGPQGRNALSKTVFNSLTEQQQRALLHDYPTIMAHKQYAIDNTQAQQRKNGVAGALSDLNKANNRKAGAAKAAATRAANKAAKARVAEFDTRTREVTRRSLTAAQYLQEGAKEYHTSAPQTARYLEALAQRLQQNPQSVSDLEMNRALHMGSGDRGREWMQPNAAQNFTYKTRDLLGMDTTGWSDF